MKHLDHIGIAVANLDAAERLFERLLGSSAEKRESVEEAGVGVAFFRAGSVKIELITPLHSSSTVQRFIEKRGEGLHHIAFSVDDIGDACRQMRTQGFQPLSDTPQKGADNKKVCFFHPKTTGGVLIELCQDEPPRGGVVK